MTQTLFSTVDLTKPIDVPEKLNDFEGVTVTENNLTIAVSYASLAQHKLISRTIESHQSTSRPMVGLGVPKS